VVRISVIASHRQEAGGSGGAAPGKLGSITVSQARTTPPRSAHFNSVTLRAAFILAVAGLAVRLDAANVRFVSPLQGSQVVGAQAIEVMTDATAVDRVDFIVDGDLIGVARDAPFRVVHDFGDSLGGHRIEAKVFSHGYQDLDIATITTSALRADVNVDLVEVPLRVISASPPTTVALDVRENGVEQTIREILPRRGAGDFVFVIDRSLSMGDGKLTAALAAVDAERRLLGPDDRASVVLFNHIVTPIRPIAPNESVAQLFGGAETSGGTSLRDAVASIPEDERTYAIVITDGSDRNSDLSEEEALQRISGTRTILDAIVLGSRGRFLDRAARNTGGEVVRASRRDIDRKLRALIEDINSRCLLVYQSAGTARGWRTIDVRPREGGIRILAARKGYFAR
jgi:hypothetical protein